MKYKIEVKKTKGELNMSNYLTIDVGGTNIKYALMDGNAEIKEKGEVPTPYDGLDAFLESIKGIYDQYADRNIEAIAMSAPGKIDATKGYFYTSGALNYINGVNLKDRLHEMIPVDFAVENDAKAAAAAEIWKGSMQGVSNGTVIVLGTGIGGAVIIDGKVYRGSTFAAGEYSGIPTTLLSGKYDPTKMWARVNGVGVMCDNYAKKIGVDPEEMNGRILFTDANDGKQEALDAIDEYCESLAAGIVSLQFVLDVERVAIGGGISKQPLLMESLHKKLHAYYDEAGAFMPATLPEVVTCEFGNDANMIGALYHYLFEIKG